MESLVLIGLDFNLTYATAFDFSEFWLSRTSPSVDRKGLKTLIHEAINTCIKGDPSPARSLACVVLHLAQPNDLPPVTYCVKCEGQCV